MNKEIKDIEKIKNIIISENKTLIIAVNNKINYPEIGYAPYIFLNKCFYIFSSELSPHIKHLLYNKKGTFMIIEDEYKAKNIWARVRLKFEAQIKIVARNEKNYNKICNQIQNSHGNTLELIKRFNDFHLIKISPIKGSIVTGFGNAFILDSISLNVKNKIKP